MMKAQIRNSLVMLACSGLLALTLCMPRRALAVNIDRSRVDERSTQTLLEVTASGDTDTGDADASDADVQVDGGPGYV